MGSGPSTSDLEVNPEPPDSELAASLLGSYFAELRQRFPGGFEPWLSGAASEEELATPNGAFLVARIGGRAVGCGAVRKLGAETAEVKHMWVDPAVRGQGTGRAMLAALEDASRKLGCRTLRLDTSSHLPEAIGLYRSSGYVETRAYNDNPYAHHWFEKRLS